NDFSSRNRPYGEVTMKETGYFIPSIQYKKSFFNKRLHLSQFIVYSRINNRLEDPLKNGYYDWLGEKHESISGSETGRDLSNLQEPVIKTFTDNITYRGVFTYYFKKKQKLVLNLVNTYLQRISDDLGTYQTKDTIKYNRFIAGLGYNYFLLNNRIE